MLQKPVPGAEQLIDRERGAAGIGGQRDIGQPVGDRDADLGAGGVQVGLGLQHVGTLGHECGRQAHRQILRQLQARKLECLRRRLAGKSPGQNGQQIVQLRRLLDQRRQGGGDLRELRFLRGQIEPLA